MPAVYYENPPQSPFDKGGGLAFPPFGKGGQGGFHLMRANTSVFMTVKPASSFFLWIPVIRAGGMTREAQFNSIVGVRCRGMNLHG